MEMAAMNMMNRATTTDSNSNCAEVFEADMSKMKMWALAGAAVNELSEYMGIFGLTWATVVILGGFAQYLHTLDLIVVSVLLLLQAIRLAASSTFGRLHSAHLFRERRHPDRFTHRDDQYLWVSRIHALGQICSFFIALSSIFISVLRILTLHSPSWASYHNNIGNIVRCLKTFYILTILTSVTAVAAVGLLHARTFRIKSSLSSSNCNICSSIQNPAPSTGHAYDRESLMAFYDAVYSCAIETGLYAAWGVSPLDFAFEKLRSDFVRNIRPDAIDNYNRRLAHYIYVDPAGIEMAYQHLQDTDVYAQMAAVNLARFWVKEGKVERQISYFVEVGKKMGRPRKLAEAACDAIDRLASEWVDIPSYWESPLAPAAQERAAPPQERGAQPSQPSSSSFARRGHPFLEAEVEQEKGKTIVDRLAELVVRPLRASLVFQLRALESCCRSRAVVDWVRKQAYYDELCEKLLQLSMVKVRKRGQQGRGGGPRVRTTIFAASAWFHLTQLQLPQGSPPAPSPPLDLLTTGVEAIHPKGDQDTKYVWKKEKELLDSLRKELGLSAYDWSDLEILDPDNLPAMQRTPTTSTSTTHPI